MPPKSRKPSTNLTVGEFLTFDRLLTGQVLQYVYWAGLGLIALFTFGIVGAGVGVAFGEEFPMSILLAFPGVIAGLLVAVVLILVWRTFCEFCSAIFRIAEDLRAIRQSQGIPPSDDRR